MRGGLKPRGKKEYQTPKLRRVRAVSKRNAKRLREYNKEAKIWKRGRLCKCFDLYGHIHQCTDVHHQRGKLGPLLMDKRFWIPVCRGLHNWIGAHPAEARKLGLLCHPGEWNKPAPQS